MRCEKCGRPMKSAELWRLGGDPKAPTSRSMRQMCWNCRQQSASATSVEETAPVKAGATTRSAVVEEAYAIVRAYEAALDANQTNSFYE